MGTIPVDEAKNLFAKTADIPPQWERLQKKNPRLSAIVADFAINFMKPRGYPAVITSIHRPDAGGVHALWRAVDVRSTLMPNDDAEEIRVAFNEKYPYGMKGDGTPGETIPPLDHKAAQTTTAVSAPHFHIQNREI